MELVFPFTNLAINYLADFLTKESALLFTGEKRNAFFIGETFEEKISEFKDRLPDFENEILQIIATTNQQTIDEYFERLGYQIQNIPEHFSLSKVIELVRKWNEESQAEFNELVDKDSASYFSSDDRKRKHLEKYQDYEYRVTGFNPMGELTKVDKINHNYYCVEKEAELIDEEFIDDYQKALIQLGDNYLEVALKYYEAHKRGEVKSQMEATPFIKPVVFVEGEHDITYIKRAAELLNHKELLDQVEIRQRGGATNLDKIWDVYKDSNWETIPQKKLLLYDCDVKKPNEETLFVFKRVIPAIESNIIEKGIENLFPTEVIQKAIQEKGAFVDITELKQLKRGEKSEKTTYSVNSDEKKNLCDWICRNGTPEDFKNFSVVFDLIKLIA
jgi:hypothetical protein